MMSRKKKNAWLTCTTKEKKPNVVTQDDKVFSDNMSHSFHCKSGVKLNW
jgi:hypothetical protein